MDNGTTSLEWVIYHLTMNDDEDFDNVELDIDLCRSDDDQWQRLLIGLSRNVTLKKLQLVRGMRRMVAADEDLDRLFDSIRSIPNLSILQLDSFSIHDLSRARELLINNATIQKMIVENVRPAANSRYEQVHVDFLFSMCQRSLRHLQIEVPMELISPASVHVPFAPLLGPTSKLQVLVIESPATVYSIMKDDFRSMMEELQSNTSLLTFDMDLQATLENLDDVSAMLRRNNTLENLSLNLHSFPQEHSERIRDFFHALRQDNHTLKKCANYGLLQMIPSTKDFLQAEWDMLEKNLSLEFFAFLNEDAEARARREFYLRLNQQGRRLLYNSTGESIPKARWVDQLEKHRDDLDGLYYYLTTNPSLCRIDPVSVLDKPCVVQSRRIHPNCVSDGVNTKRQCPAIVNGENLEVKRQRAQEQILHRMLW